MDLRQFEVLRRQVKSLYYSTEKTIIDLRERLRIKLDRWASPYKSHKTIEFSEVTWSTWAPVIIFYNKVNILELSVDEDMDDEFEFKFDGSELEIFQNEYVLQPELIQVPFRYLESLFKDLDVLGIRYPSKRFYSVYITPRKLFGYYERDDVYPIWGLRKKDKLEELCDVADKVEVIAIQGNLIVAKLYRSITFYDMKFKYRFLNHYVVDKEGKSDEKLFFTSYPVAVKYNGELFWGVSAYIDKDAVLKSEDHEDVEIQQGWYTFLHPEPDTRD